jgi:hypothetical protein
MGDCVTIHLHGSFRVVAFDGRELTPSSAKARALLTLLALAPEFRRSRAWLQSRLWQERLPRKAAGSLRQCLLEARRALGEHASILKAGRSYVELDASGFVIAHATAPGDPADLLHDLAVKNATLSATIDKAQARIYGSASLRATVPRRLRVVIDITTGDSAKGKANAALLRDMLIRSATELFDATILNGRDGVTDHDVGPGLLVVVTMLDLGPDRPSMSARIEELSSLRCFWSALAPPQPAGGGVDGDGCARFVQGIVQALLDVIAQGEMGHGVGSDQNSAVLAASAVRKMFSMQQSELVVAGRLLDRAIALRPRGLYYAWRAQWATICMIELHSKEAAILRATASSDITSALALEPMNSNVLACASNVRRAFDKDFEAALLLARQSILANPSNPLGWWALASAQLYCGRKDEAYRSAVKAQAFSDQTSLQAWADFQLSLTAAINQFYDVAVSFGVSAHTLAPHFRAPLRYLIAVSARSGQIATGRRATQKLRSLEPNFTVKQFWIDPTYPVSIMRSSHLVEPQMLLRIEGDSFST